jgi:preprotein translocase subunit Sec61beta
MAFGAVGGLMSVGGCLRFFEEVESVSETSSAAAVAAGGGVAVVVAFVSSFATEEDALSVASD